MKKQCVKIIAACTEIAFQKTYLYVAAILVTLVQHVNKSVTMAT